MHFKKYIVMCLCPRETVFGSFVTIQQRSHAFQGNFNNGNEMTTAMHRLRNNLKCVQWDVKPCSINQSVLLSLVFSRGRESYWS